jgi:hypothetical protein
MLLFGLWLRLHEEDNCFDVYNDCKYECKCECFFYDVHTAFGSVSERPTRLLFVLER